MADMNRLLIKGHERKRRDLIVEEPPLLREVQILEPREGNTVKIYHLVLEE